MRTLAVTACTSFVMGCVASKIYKYVRAPAPAPLDLSEVRFTCPTSSCCIDEVKPECVNPNCKARNEKRLIQLIDSAQNTILLAMYIFTSKRLSEAIVAAHNRGVRVLIIGCRSMAFSSGSQMVLLEKLNIPVRFPLDNNKLVHHKFCLIDTVAPPTTVAPANMCAQASHVLQLPAHGVLITGSMNWTLNAISGNWDNFIITSEEQIVRTFANEFIRIWSNFHPEQSQQRR